MFLTPRLSRLSAKLRPVSESRSPVRGWLLMVLPWAFIAGIVVGAVLIGPGRQPLSETERRYARDSETIWQRAGNPAVRHPVDVLRTMDGDTFEARVHLWPGLDLMTRVRLRGIDAPELKAMCAQEAKLAATAATALRFLLEEGQVAIYNIGPDKYSGRVVADVATQRTPSVSAALLKAGHVRSYQGGRRNSWC